MVPPAGFEPALHVFETCDSTVWPTEASRWFCTLKDSNFQLRRLRPATIPFCPRVPGGTSRTRTERAQRSRRCRYTNSLQCPMINGVWCLRLDSNQHCFRFKRNASYQLRYAGVGKFPPKTKKPARIAGFTSSVQRTSISQPSASLQARITTGRREDER